MVVGQTIPKTMRYIKKSKLDQSFTILYDKQERKPWILPPQYPMELVHLKEEEYTIKGNERDGRAKDKEEIMEKLRSLGYM